MDDADTRASDAEREGAMGRLRDAAGEGRLTFEELADRLQAAGTATTRGELETLTRDLPGSGSGSGPAAGPVSAPGPAAAPELPAATSSSVFGDLRRDGVWRVPERSRWSTVFGDVVLDLRDATDRPGARRRGARSPMSPRRAGRCRPSNPRRSAWRSR